MRTSMITAALALALGMGSCSDDTKTNTYDKSITKDTGTKVDQPITQKDTSTQKDTGTTQKDTGPAKEFTVKLDGPGPYTCLQISYCAKPCGTDLACVGVCSAKGCQSAKDAFTALSNCSIAKCILDCIKGFDDVCAACALKNCPTEYNACQNGKC